MSGSSARAVLQIVPTFAPRDAIGDHARQVDRLLKDNGVKTAIYAQTIVPEIAHLARPFQELAAGRDTGGVLLHHHSTGTAVVDQLLERPEPLVIDYHNITPAALFEPWEPVVAAELAWGRRQLETMRGRAHAALADSRFNASELRHLGWPRVAVAAEAPWSWQVRVGPVEADLATARPLSADTWLGALHEAGFLATAVHADDGQSYLVTARLTP